ncbi:TPA: hypothetical protein DIC40_03450 [Patescibacteria group bacterium]|nr:hypothetical protein [Candidatus Gracilibacteria bacterium]
MLELLFSFGAFLKVASNVWLFILIELFFLITYLQKGVPSLLFIVLGYPFLFLISIVLWKEYLRAKNFFLERYKSIKKQISQELYDGKKLTNWQNELNNISEFLEQQGVLEKKSLF